MKVHQKYFSGNIRDAHEKMRNCIVWADNTWYWLYNYVDDWRIEAIPIEQGKQHCILDLAKINEENFKVGPFSLGMSNWRGVGVYFVSRRPLRRNKFGLREENCDIVHIAGEENEPRGLQRDFNALLQANALYQTLQGMYPSYLQALDTVRKEHVTAVAFDRAFALERVGLRTAVLKYRTASIGELSLTKGDVELYPAYSHMVERCSAIAGCPSVSVFKE